MRTIAKLFGRSPFVPLQAHMSKVADCVAKIEPILAAFLAGDQQRVEQLAEEISRLEHEADQAKHDIQNGLRKGMFLAVDRTRLLQIVAIQDGLADKAENLGAVLTLKTMQPPTSITEQLQTFVSKNLEAFQAVHLIIEQLDELLESSFGGSEAQKVSEMVHQVAVLEHEADRIQHDLLKGLFAHEEELSHGSFYLWLQIFKHIGELADISETLANRIHSTLEIK